MLRMQFFNQIFEILNSKKDTVRKKLLINSSIFETFAIFYLLSIYFYTFLILRDYKQGCSLKFQKVIMHELLMVNLVPLQNRWL